MLTINLKSLIANYKRWFFLLFLLATSIAGFSQEHSVLATGEWYRFSVNREGMYRLRGTDLQAAGFDLDGLDPAKIHLAAFPGGPLPQPNDASGPEILQEISCTIIGGEDGRMNPQDQIVFYLQGPHLLNITGAGFDYHHNPYDTKNYLFVGITASPGKRISTNTTDYSAGAVINQYDQVIAHEESLNNLLESGRNWYGVRFDASLSQTFSLDLPGIVPGSEIELEPTVMAQSFSPATFRWYWNNISIGEQTVDKVPDYLDPPTNNLNRYSVKGIARTDLFNFQASASPPATVQIRTEYEKGGSGRSIGFLDNFILHVQRTLRLYNSQVLFTSLSATGNPVTYQLDQMSPAYVIWDITDPMEPLEREFSLNGTTGEFNDFHGEQTFFAAFDPAQLPVPQQEGTVSNQDLPARPTPDLLIVTHPDFISAANKLAQFRQTHDQLATAVVTTTQVFNEFSGGRHDVTAIRNFARRLYKGGSLKYLLLMGRGSYDYLDIIPNNTNYVPIYQSRNSLHPLLTYASDDYFGFLEDDEGAWEEAPGGNHTMEIGVGRLPVTTPEQALGVVDKLIRYDTDPRMIREWRTKLVFVADDEDNNEHQRQADRLSVLADTTFRKYLIDKIYLGAYQQESTGGGQTSPSATQAISQAVASGALIVNYTGHGGENGWAQEYILDRQMIRHWDNKYRLPLFVTATCEFGRHDNPREISGGELIVTQPGSGGIGILTTGRDVYAISNFELNKAFYESVFQPVDNQMPRLGDVIRSTKNLSVDNAFDENKVGNRNFNLLGDPSLKLAYPEGEVVVKDMLVDGVSRDTLAAGAEIVIRGEVQTDGAIRNENFNGTVHAIVQDKSVEKETIDTPVFSYSNRENIIFQGEVTVSSGEFDIHFIVPKNVSNQPGNGRIHLYAFSGEQDAAGVKSDVATGGTSSRLSSDSDGPGIQLFFGDSTNISRKNINTSTLIFAKLTDESGINTSGFGVGNSITATIDDREYQLNRYYTASRDSYKEGWVIFPVNDLTKGTHTLTMKAFDVYNQSGEITVEFSVADPGTLVLTQVRNYPQPVFDHTTFRFDHNRPGETLEVRFELIGRNGQLLDAHEYLVEDSAASVELMRWERAAAAQKLEPGIYFYGISVRSTLDGATSRKYQKMILIN